MASDSYMAWLVLGSIRYGNWEGGGRVTGRGGGLIKGCSFLRGRGRRVCVCERAISKQERQSSRARCKPALKSLLMPPPKKTAHLRFPAQLDRFGAPCDPPLGAWVDHHVQV